MISLKCEAELLRKEKITNDVWRLTLLAPDLAKAAGAGQFVMVRAGKSLGPPLWRRPFSIHQVLVGGGIQLLIKVVGPGTEFIVGRQPGEFLNLVGPLGKGFTLPDHSENVCIIGGGVGAAPLFYLASQLVGGAIKPEFIKIFLGGATASDILILKKDFAALGVSVEVATDDGTAGYHGLVTELLFNRLRPDNPWRVYSCGPHPMMKSVARYCLERKWPCQVSLETLMACGISACLGCAVPSSGQTANNGEGPYLHVCKEGPVFEAGEVAWE
jgi:dihydroorotate dehydrogenase electron transfer subunit